MRFDLDKNLGISPDALKVYAKRAELLAGNLANADTPGFQARDIDFKNALQSMNATTHNSSVVKTTNSKHINTSTGMSDRINDVLGEIKFRVPQQPSLDGNTVDPLTEKAAFMENAMMYQTAIKFLGDKFKLTEATGIARF